MTDAGFFRGTSADQDNRFANKQKKLLKELNFSPILNTKLHMSKIDIESLKPWIEEKIKQVLEKEDELLSESIYEHLAEKEPDGKNILVLITGFVDDSKASKFMEELWTKLIDLQENNNGKSSNDNPNSESKLNDQTVEGLTKSDMLKESNNNSNDGQANQESKVGDEDDKNRNSRSSHSVTPPSRSVSKSPGNHRLDERSRGRPRRRPLDETSRDGSVSPAAEGRQPRSRSSSHSRSRSGSRSRSPIGGSGDARVETRKRSRSRSISKHSGSRSRSRSYSRSSRSSSRSSRRRSRSPYGHSQRGQRSRSRSRGYRPRSRSRSPRGRRGYVGMRGSYRGSFGYNDRRRGLMPPMRRRSPWGRRRFSPASPIRRRRTPSFSPRRRRTPSPYIRRSRSRSPPGHMMNRNISPPRQHIMSGVGRIDMMGGRHVPHHDTHRQMLPIPRSPRIPLDRRAYGDGPMLPRHSPGPIVSKPLDLPPSHGLISNQPGPSGSVAIHSPPSSRKKHKKEKKHKKHKKSKKHHRSSPEKKKKHKKHSKKSSKKKKSPS